jgi:hypothetical protein
MSVTALIVLNQERGGAPVLRMIAAVDRDDPRPVWFSNRGTDHGSAASCLKRALDRGQEGYAQFKAKLRLSSYDAFGDHSTTLNPPWTFGWTPSGPSWTANAGITGSPP